MLIWADYAILGVCGLSALISLVRGFIKEALSLTIWLAAFWIAFHFSGSLAGILAFYVESRAMQILAAFLILFIVTLLLGGLINYLVSQLIIHTGLTGADRLLGVVFGFLRGVLLIALFLLLARLTPAPQSAWWRESLLIPSFAPLELWLNGFMPKTIDTQLQDTK